jgi:adenylate cyclase
MTNRERRGWRVFLWLSLGALVPSVVFGIQVAETTLGGIEAGIISCLFIATPVLLLEIKGRRLPIERRMRRLPLVIYLGIRVILYVVIIITGLLAARLVMGRPVSFTEIFQDGSVTFSVAMSVLANVTFAMGNLVGFRTVGRLLTGRYIRPRREHRVFLLIDMKNSTGVAERLGALRFHELLNTFFDDISEGALECSAEIHKFVGDEVILTWPADRTPIDEEVLACPFVVRDSIAANGAQYRRRFGLAPEFRAAMHCGEIVAGQIGMGEVRAEIAYVGDTLNVAARLLEAAKDVGRDVLVSADLLAKATLPKGIVAESLPTLAVRGREAPLGIAALSRT